MANRQNLGEALGMMLSGGLDKSKRDQGYEDGIKAQLGLSNIDLNKANIGKDNAETALKTQQANYGTDDSLISGLLSSIGANSADGINDFKSTMAGNYKPLVGAPTQQQAQQGNTALPQPAYLDKFPDLQQKFAGLKQMLALRDTNYDHLSQGLHSDQLNQLTANITPQNAVDVGNNVAAFNGKPDDVLKAQLTNRIASDGKPNGNERGLLYMQGKPEFNNLGSDGTYSGINGNQSINAIGQSVIDKNGTVKEGKDKPAPSGYAFNPDGTLNFIKGGPADPQLKESQPLGNRESVYISRIGIAANETAKALNNITKLPLTIDSGIFGGRKQGGSLFDAGKEALTNKMTSQDVQSYNVLSSGFQRSLAAIEAAGLAPSGTLSHQMESVLFKEGDTNFTKLQKLAETKQIVSAGLETTLSNPRIPKEQRDHFQQVLNQLNKSVPFDNADLITLQGMLENNPNASINEVLKLKQQQAPDSASRLTDVRLLTDGRKVGRNASGKLEVMQ